MACQALLAKHPAAWRGAVTHKFLAECQRGEIGENQFDTWLVQDFFFAREFTRFAALALSKAPPEHFDVLLGGLAALQDELRWFQHTAQERGLSLQADPHPTCRQYIAFMTDFAEQPYAVQAAAFWAIERAYNEAWASHSPMKEPYHTFGQRWGAPAFGQYVKDLERQADEVLAGSGLFEKEAAERAFLRVCELERAFWDMAYSSTAYE